jgi:hypothetical protein
VAPSTKPAAAEFGVSVAADEISSLLAQAAVSFVGTVQHVSASTMADVAADERTVVVHVDEVMHAPEAFTTLSGSLITLQPAADLEPPEEGSTWLFFANGVAFGQSIVLAEVARVSVDVLESDERLAAGADATSPFERLQVQAEADQLRAHAEQADAVIVGRVVGLERAAGAPVREHDADWWRATLHVVHVERGAVEPDSEVQTLYANSLDVRWRDAPKPRASQNGLWLLHATEGELAELAPFRILHRDDYQPVTSLEWLRQDGPP